MQNGVSALIRKRISSLCLLLRRYARPTGADNIIASLASKRSLSTDGRVIERKTFKLILLWRRYGDVIINPAVGGGQRFIQRRAELSVDPSIPPSLLGGLPPVAWIEN